jgi:cytochrome P450 family 6
MNSIKDPDAIFRRMGKKIFDQNDNIQFKAFFLTSFQDLGRKLHMRFLPKDVSDFFLNTIRETVDNRLKNNIQRNDVMDLLLKLKDNGTREEGKISFNELAAQCKIFIKIILQLIFFDTNFISGFIWFVAGDKKFLNF